MIKNLYLGLGVTIMSVNINREATIGSKDESVKMDRHESAMGSDILSKYEFIRDLNTQDINALIRLYDYLLHNSKGVVTLNLKDIQDVLALGGVSHSMLEFMFKGTLIDITNASYDPVLELLNPYVTFKGYNEDIIKKIQIRSLDLSHSDITDVSMLGKIHTLNLSYTKVKVVKDLGDVRVLDLRGTKVTDVSALGKVHTLDLSYTKVSNVKELGGVHTLYLYNTEVTDVSALGKVHTLDLGYTKVSNVKDLGDVHTLYLICTDVTDVSALVNVHTLDLCCTDVTDVSALVNVHTLDLSYTKITDVSMLGKVHTLNIIGTKVTDYSALKDVVNLKH